MATDHRISACTTASFHETGIVAADLSVDADEKSEKHDGFDDLMDRELEKDKKSAGRTSECEKHDSVEDSDGLSIGGRDALEFTTYPELPEEDLRGDTERPKKVSTRRRRWALWYLLRFHVPSLVITLFLMVLYCRNWIWTAPGPSAEMLNALQFAAKIHEGLVILSLTNIVLHRLRFLLLQGQGVPLGLLTSPFQLASPLYFMTSEFWGAVGSSVKGLSGVATVALVLLCMALALAIGPFSAIVMLPNYGLWRVPNGYLGMADYLAPDNDEYKLPIGYSTAEIPTTEHILSFVAAVSPENLYPMSLGPELGVTWTCPDRLVYGSNSWGCRTIFNQYFHYIIKQSKDMPRSAEDYLVGLSDSGHKDSDDNDNNINPDGSMDYPDYVQEMGMVNISNLRSAGTVWAADFPGDQWSTVSLATTPLWLTAYVVTGERSKLAGIGDLNDFILKKPAYTNARGEPVAMKQPAALTQCTQNRGFTQDNFTTGAIFQLTTGLFPAFNLTVDEELAAVARACNLSRKDGCLTFVDIQPLVPYPISTAVMAVSADYDFFDNRTGNMDVTICLLSARWEAAEAWGGHSQYDWGVLASDPVTLVNQTQHVPASEVIRIDADFMMGLDYSPYYDVLEKDLRADDAPSDYDYLAAVGLGQPNSLAMALSSMVASSLAAVQCAFMVCVVFTSTQDWSYYNFTHLRSNEEALAAGDELRVTTSYWINAYGYGVRDSWLTAVGVAVLLLHAAMVLVHVALILGRGFWTSDRWGSLGELVALALRSSPPGALRNATAGVKRTGTWQLVAVVRERVSEGRLELVLGGRTGGMEGDVERGGEVAGERRDEAVWAVARSDKKYG